MKIILEGPDNAGKSTLAKYLADALDLPIVVSGGPSKWPGEVNDRSERFNKDHATAIYDRHPCISQNLYQEALTLDGERVLDHHVEAFYDQEPFIIYCRNIQGADGHVLSEHSSAEYFQLVQQNMTKLGQLYDAWALSKAQYVYRIGDSMADALLAVKGQLIEFRPFDPVADIAEFHIKFQQVYTGKPRTLDADLASFREKFLGEELEEYEGAAAAARMMTEGLHLWDEAEFVHQLETQADSLVDLVYVALGTAHLQGFDFREMWRRVHAANMSKVLAMREGQIIGGVTDSGRDKRFDVVKPTGWEPPTHTDLVENHAHRGIVPANGEAAPVTVE